MTSRRFSFSTICIDNQNIDQQEKKKQRKQKQKQETCKERQVTC